MGLPPADQPDRRAGARWLPEPRTCAPRLADPVLAIAADVLDDLERVRIANENRLRQLTRDVEDEDGEQRGLGLPLDHPDVARLSMIVDTMAQSEHQAELNLKRMMRRHPLGPWVAQARGIGEKQAARLLATIGDPYWNDLHQRPRTVSELWAYAGYHVLPAGQVGRDTHPGPASGGQLRTDQIRLDAQSGYVGPAHTPVGQASAGAHTLLAGGNQHGGDPDHPLPEGHRSGVGVAAARARGQRANWSASAKMRAYLVAVSIVKAGGPYREVYDQARAKYDGALHQVECKRCGPSGKPAQPGSPISAGHQHARALRAVAKEVLKDLWREAKRLHEES
jgi:hypothetical protein